MKSLRPAFWLYALPALALAALPASHDALLYDRAAIFRGEFWRLWTGHWVHFSSSHLGWNLLALLIAGPWLEQLRPGLLGRYTVLATPLISAALLVFAPDMAYYGGLSGLATGVVALLALELINHQSTNPIWGWSLLTLIIAKIACDLSQQHALLTEFNAPDIRSSNAAHALGTILAAIIYAFSSHPETTAIKATSSTP